MLVADIKHDEYKQLPLIPRSEIKLLHIADKWDGALRGTCLYNGQEYRFDITADWQDEDVDFHAPRHYLLIELTPEQLESEHYWQALFAEKVYDYSNEAGHVGAGYRNPATHDEFYGPYKAWLAENPPDYSQNVVIGWFRERDGE